MSQIGKLIDNLPLTTKPSKLKIGRELNRGAYGFVHEGVLAGRSVAVKGIHKLLLEADGGENALRSFCEECERLETLEHPHVIKFLGAYKDAKLGPILVMERMNENLRWFLENNKDKVTVQEQVRISLEITQGVAFLHQLNPPMVHRDLNDKNVMFTFDGVAKIGDFGQSKLKQELYFSTTQPGMLPYMPPEALRIEDAKYDESLDVFSLGVLMLEIGTQQPPIANMVGIGTIPEIKRREKDLGRMEDLHPLKPFILLCLSDNQKKRPKATELQMVLPRLEENILQTLIAAEEQFRRMEEELTSENKEATELFVQQIVAYEEDFTAERRDRLRSHSARTAKEKEWMDKLAGLSQERDNDVLTLKKQLATVEREQEAKRKEELAAAKSKMDQAMEALKEEYRSNLKKKEDDIHALQEDVRSLKHTTDWLKHEDKKKEKEKKLFGKHSKMDQKRTSLKDVFGTIVKKKDNEILMQIDEIEELRRQVETFGDLLSEKCCRVRALEIENAQLRETYCLPDEEEPLLGHSGKESAAGDIECISFEQPLSTTSVHSTGHPKHASSYKTVETQHRQHHHDDPQTRLLEADRQQDVGEPAPAEAFTTKGEMEHSEADHQGTGHESNHSSSKASHHVCPVQD